PPFRIAEFDVIFGQGISRLGCLLDVAEEMGVVTRRGAWYSYEGDNIVQGRDNTIQRLKEDPEFAQTIEQQVRRRLHLDAGGSASMEDSSDQELDD
ncbi:MAG: DNA recombination/repair protein RecA, partial [Pseudanabaenales cyanobacterium]|nr:DNA recombination/repair protein RecA [Pseudanabaenales cyanobacterium]